MLYQLRNTHFTFLSPLHVFLNGPHDKYGKIISVKNGLYLIRGIGNTKPTNT